MLTTVWRFVMCRRDTIFKVEVWLDGLYDKESLLLRLVQMSFSCYDTRKDFPKWYLMCWTPTTYALVKARITHGSSRNF
jgi:hypothetical protein